MVKGFPIFRIGNTRDTLGKELAQFAKVPELKSDADISYNPKSRRPVWHTDSTFRQHPPIGSVFQCRIAPPSGSDTLFADTRKAYADLDIKIQEKLLDLEAICSLAHHDKKISLYSPGYPVLTPEQREKNPPRRVPIVLKHPVTGLNALYGLNSSTCAVLPKGKELARNTLDACDLEGIEDKSVLILRDLLPHITGPNYTIRWQWESGDIVIWDNRCTIHAATGFDNEKYSREMWRLTLLENSSRILTQPKL
jgi:taurine dioxygenase